MSDPEYVAFTLRIPRGLIEAWLEGRTNYRITGLNLMAPNQAVIDYVEDVV